MKIIDRKTKQFIIQKYIIKTIQLKLFLLLQN